MRVLKRLARSIRTLLRANDTTQQKRTSGRPLPSHVEDIALTRRTISTRRDSPRIAQVKKVPPGSRATPVVASLPGVKASRVGRKKTRKVTLPSTREVRRTPIVRLPVIKQVGSSSVPSRYAMAPVPKGDTRSPAVAAVREITTTRTSALLALASRPPNASS